MSARSLHSIATIETRWRNCEADSNGTSVESAVPNYDNEVYCAETENASEVYGIGPLSPRSTASSPALRSTSADNPTGRIDAQNVSHSAAGGTHL